MRALSVVLLVLAALCGCGKAKAPPRPPGPPPPRLLAAPLLEGEVVVLDGASGDKVWDRATELLLPLTGPGPSEVHLKAAYDADRLYLFAIWSDAEVSMSRYYEYTKDDEWVAHDGEDGFAVCWAPGVDAAPFREQGCALYCHDGKHEYQAKSGYVDFWEWQAQQTRPHNQARDCWLPAGNNQRLRGDGQPEDSDNYPNMREDVFMPKYVPFRVGPTATRFLFPGNVNELPRDWKRKLDPKTNIGWQVARDILRPMKGSRGDVAAASRHAAGAWVLELTRRLRTGNGDDQPLGDPIVPALFSVAIHNGSGGKDHAVSGPVELHFVSTP